MNNYDYPMGADTPNAPWNQVDPEPRKIKVTVSITLSKTVEVEVDDYTTEETNEDGCHGVTYYFDESNLEQAVRSQIDLPSKKYSDWSEDDFVVNLE